MMLIARLIVCLIEWYWQEEKEEVDYDDDDYDDDFLINWRLAGVGIGG